jgi:hypothetical protein
MIYNYPVHPILNTPQAMALMGDHGFDGGGNHIFGTME